MFSFSSSTPSAKPKPFRILSLDGGGVRAILEATILKKLVQTYPNLLEEVDMFAGTSAGGIVASALVSGYDPDYVCNLWMNAAPKIFAEGWSRKVRSIDNCIGASYVADPLKEMLESTLGDKKLGDLKKKFLAPSFCLDESSLEKSKGQTKRWGPEFIHNFDEKHKDVKLVDAILRTTAAPTYFPIYQGYVDGGVFANNPALGAVTTAVNYGIPRQDIVVLSLSTGNNPKCIDKQTYGDGNWGMVEWGPHLIELLLDGGTESINYSCSCLLHDNYHRVDPLLPTDIGLDDAAELQALVEVAEKVDLTSTQKWIADVWKTDVNAKKTTTNSIPIVKIDSNEPTNANWRCNIQ